jgi:membrane-associated phospholipid phosphatase
VVRLALGAAGLTASALLARSQQVGRREERAFRAVNELPDWLWGPTWPLMQLGNVVAAPAAATVAALAGDRRLGRRLLVGGVAAWALSKAVKRCVGRPRPAVLLAETRRRGREQSGLGYLSGHAAVAVALGTAALPSMSREGRLAVAAAMPMVGLCRLYVGAHLPLDVVGGASLGLVVESATILVWPTVEPRGGRRPARRR